MSQAPTCLYSRTPLLLCFSLQPSCSSSLPTTSARLLPTQGSHLPCAALSCPALPCPALRCPVLPCAAQPRLAHPSSAQSSPDFPSLHTLHRPSSCLLLKVMLLVSYTALATMQDHRARVPMLLTGVLRVGIPHWHSRHSADMCARHWG